MRLLLDTHIALWAITNNSKLSAAARAMILDPRNAVYYSAVSTWEIAIKTSLGGDLPCSAEIAQRDFEASGYEALPILPRHTVRVETLAPVHRDPFDRLLLAQALTEPMHLLTHDAAFARYACDLVLMV